MGGSFGPPSPVAIDALAVSKKIWQFKLRIIADGLAVGAIGSVGDARNSLFER
jgi:hypothetical protein